MEDNFSNINLSYDNGFSGDGLSLAVSPTLDTSSSSFAADSAGVDSGISQFNSALAAGQTTLNTPLQSAALTSTTTSGGGSSGGTSWLNIASSLIGDVGSLTKSAGSLYQTVSGNGQPAFTYSPTTGQKIPIASGVVANPGSTSVIGGSTGTNALGSIGSTISGTLGQLTQFVPLLVIGGIIYFVLKLVRGK